MAALATVDDVADVIGPIPEAAATRVSNLLDKVSASVRRYTGQTFDAVTDDVVRVWPRDGYVRLPQRPVTAVSSVVIYGTAMAEGSYEFTANGYLRPLAPLLWDNGWECPDWLWPSTPVTVTYDHGGGSPPDIALVVAQKAGALYRFGVEGTQAEAIDGYSATYRAPGAGAAWTPDQKMILDSYRRSGLASVRLI